MRQFRVIRSLVVIEINALFKAYEKYKKGLRDFHGNLCMIHGEP